MKNKTDKYSVDRMMRNVASSLLRDFQNNSNDPCLYCDLQQALRAEDVTRIRELLPTPDDSMDIHSYKAAYQLQSVFKRYRFSNDTYSDQELVDKAILGFRETQNRLADVDLTSLPSNSERVLDFAASYIAKVLGVYDDQECRQFSRFGKKASVGVSARDACEAARWKIPISGSSEQISWFRSEMDDVECVQEYLTAQLDSDPNGSIYQEISSLKLTLVPKTFKSLRSIMPNTTIGSYMSFGIGEMIRKRLRREGYNIRTLQQRHKLLAQSASIHGLYATTDLSSASDSITVALVKRLFPADWFEILNRSRIGNVTLPDSSCIESLTFCTMGIGYTFPLQTLVFLSLLKGIEAILYHRLDRRMISVYGDDMIYSSRMHLAVVHFFEQFGFVINLDKTFHEGNFRESCGGDYYHGVDVRPFQPRNGPAIVSKHAYEAILYKYVNGLLARWSEYEIGMTLNYLVSEISSIVHKVKIVPGDYPDDSGVKCHYLGCHGFLTASICAQPKFLGHGVYRFSFLRLVPDKRKETRHEPFLWLGLRDGHVHTDDYSGHGLQGKPVSYLSDLINEAVGITGYVSPFSLEEDTPITTFRSKISGRRLRRMSTYVTVSHTGRYTRRSGTSCFEDRR